MTKGDERSQWHEDKLLVTASSTADGLARLHSEPFLYEWRDSAEGRDFTFEQRLQQYTAPPVEAASHPYPIPTRGLVMF